MKTSTLYLFLFIAGTIIPYYEFINFLFENGLDLTLFFKELLATSISRFFAYDVLISALVLLVFIIHERNKAKNYWMAMMATLLIGVSAGLPLFLYLKEVKSNETNKLT
ncbi:DUF2834 domain-containing protein [Flammeovirga sp. EKP202]|uniref:DUF2834 domain-containing protein n=1 Tax=Flammeovirga sp. EKP202 TaxID=2770592 RepID=UPI00165EE841|nr:DUF2834 domain-containing protein [Flammeovirga sp. EKP202]MBD0403270.1 DUF2834 domain-containing protein [Flammeovirga sp. EKP202]